MHGERRTKAIEVSTVATPAFGIRRSARTGPSASLCVTLMRLPAISDQWTVVVLRTINRYLEGSIGCADDAHRGTIICSTLLSTCTSSTQKQLSLCSTSVWFSFSLYNTTRRDATRRDATRRKAKQSKAKQSKAKQRNAKQRNATQSNATQRNAKQRKAT